MKLVIYLRLTENGTFQFSNTTDFEINKSSGVVQKGANDYVMVYESVNGADKSISDGLTSSFFVDNEGRLDFTHCEKFIMVRHQQQQRATAPMRNCLQ